MATTITIINIIIIIIIGAHCIAQNRSLQRAEGFKAVVQYTLFTESQDCSLAAPPPPDWRMAEHTSGFGSMPVVFCFCPSSDCRNTARNCTIFLTCLFVSEQHHRPTQLWNNSCRLLTRCNSAAEMEEKVKYRAARRTSGLAKVWCLGKACLRLPTLPRLRIPSLAVM